MWPETMSGVEKN
uniref:Uncharacterized protein n=1 Tax=Rhizophora mucronata TaxID=61149 RepID=A0A2P2NL45_RHIMU